MPQIDVNVVYTTSRHICAVTGEVILPGSFAYHWNLIGARFYAKVRPERWRLYGVVHRPFYHCFTELDALKPSDGLSRWKDVYARSRASIPAAMYSYSSLLARKDFAWEDGVEARITNFVKEVEQWLPSFDAEVEYIHSLEEVTDDDWPSIKERHDAFRATVPDYG